MMVLLVFHNTHLNYRFQKLQLFILATLLITKFKKKTILIKNCTYKDTHDSQIQTNNRADIRQAILIYIKHKTK